MRPATRDDVARAAGVSTAVVSYVINNGPRAVSPRTRERVLRAIEELGYLPHGVAQALAAGSSRSLGLVVPDVRMPYFGGIAQEITTQASALGYPVLIGTSGWSLEAEHEQLRVLAHRRVNGVVLMSVRPEQATASPSAGPLVVVDRPSFATEGAAAVTRHLIGHGRRRIGLVATAGRYTATERRAAGWRAELDRAGLPTDLVCEVPATEEGGFAAAGMLDRCDAVVTETDAQALGVLSRWHRDGVRCPGDVALASTDSTSLAAYVVPSLTSLRQPTRDIAREAVTALVDASTTEVRFLNHEGFDLVERESCGCPPPGRD